jgi:uncharacterized membrane protein
MSTAVPTVPLRPGKAAGPILVRALLWLALAAAAALAVRFLLRDAVKYFATPTAATFGDFWPRRGALWLHIGCSAAALIVGSLQFWTALRMRAFRVHRWTGRLYAAAIAVAASSALYLAWKTSLGWPFGVPLAVTATLWLASTALAVTAIRARRVQRHREWVARSYALTFFFVWIRFLYDLPGVQRLGTDAQVGAITAWASLVISLAAAEVVIRARLLAPARRRAARPA